MPRRSRHTTFFRFARFQTLRAKLVLAFSAFLLITLLICLSFFWFERAQSDVLEMTELVQDVNMRIQEAYICEKHFFDYEVVNEFFYSSGESGFIDEHRQLVTRIQADMSALQGYPELRDTEIPARLDTVNLHIARFQAAFDSLVQLLVMRGFVDQGLEGNMRQAIHEIEVSPYPIPREAILLVRRYEKDYFLRKESRYVTQWKKAVQELRLAAARNIPQADVLENFENVLSFYEQNFLHIVEIEERMGTDSDKGLKGEVSNQLDAVTLNIRQIHDQVNQLAADSNRRAAWTLAVLVTMLVVVNVIILYAVVQRLGKPIQTLSASIRQVMHHNFETEFQLASIRSRDEVGRLAHDFNLMVEKVRRHNKEILAQKEAVSTAYQHLQTLSLMGQRVTAELSPETIVATVYDELNRVMDARVLALGVYDPEQQVLQFFGQDDQRFSLLGQDHLKEANQLSVWCFRQVQPVFINDYEAEYRQYVPDNKLPDPAHPRHSMLYVPLQVQNTCIGVLTVQSFEKQAYSAHHLSLLQSLGIYIAIALENARAYSEISRQAQTLQASEEELRQNAEELKATNEQLKKSQLDIELKNKQLSVLISQIQRQKDVIEKKNEDITASINYALRIQGIILPPAQNIHQYLPDSFIFFRPKDIVSGDFYFFSVVHHPLSHQALPEYGTRLVLAAADCMGHGVPGAFMSLIGSNILSQIVNEKRIDQADEILNYLHVSIRTTLRQEETLNEESMDIALVVIDLTAKKMQFAGAKNPIFYTTQKRLLPELLAIKGDKMQIGGSEFGAKVQFTLHEIDISQPTTFYLASDGYQDQFGGQRNRKFMVGQFKQLLAEIAHEPMEQQRQILEATILSWMHGTEQVDDILVIGARVGG